MIPVFHIIYGSNPSNVLAPTTTAEISMPKFDDEMLKGKLVELALERRVEGKQNGGRGRGWQDFWGKFGRYWKIIRECGVEDDDEVVGGKTFEENFEDIESY